jgi:hypothetical protein
MEELILPGKRFSRVLNLLLFHAVNQDLVFYNKADKKARHQQGLDVVHIYLKGSYGLDQMRIPVPHKITGQDNNNMGCKNNGADLSRGQEKDDNYAQHKICRHAAVDAAVGKIEDRKQDVPQHNQRNIGSYLMQIVTVAHHEKGDDAKKYGKHGQHGIGVRLFYDPGGGGRDHRRQAKGAHHVHNPGVQGKFIGKNIPVNQRFYQFHILVEALPALTIASIAFCGSTGIFSLPAGSCL